MPVIPIFDLSPASFVFTSSCAVVATLMSMCSIAWAVRCIGSYLIRLGRASRPHMPLQVVLRDIDLPHLSAGLCHFADHTRNLVCDLWGMLARARAWPSSDEGRMSYRWWTRLIGGGDDRSYDPLSYISREVWVWIQMFERLDAHDRAELNARGIDVDRARALLFGAGPFVQRSAELLRWLIHIDVQLHTPVCDPYRGTVRVAADMGGLTLSRVLESVPTPELLDTDRDQDSVEDELAANHVAPIDSEARQRRFEEAMHLHRSTIAAMCRKYTHSKADAEDLLQDVTLEIWRALPRFREDCSLRTYILRIARFRIIDHMRRRRAHLPEVAVNDPTADLEGHAVQSERYAALRRAIRCLPRGLRDVISLRLEDRSYAEIADEVGISETNVSVRLTRARHALRRSLCDAV